ncbi:MAG: insulinase family protein [Firmicutes bacterium]|nr:insulinase family protein [Bacillota bacterium]
MAQKFKLTNGMDVVVEQMAGCRSVACGLWARAGSAWESDNIAGISHFLEHMLFKGTEKRNAQQIAAAMDDVGGMLNAFTGKECTCYYTRALDEHFSLSLDLLSDIYVHSQLREQECKLEKDVIIEEINMYEDTPDDVAGDLFAATLWPRHSYGRSVIGGKESVQAITQTDLHDYYRRNYAPCNTVLAIAGNVTPKAAVYEAEHYLGDFAGIAKAPKSKIPQTKSGSSAIYKDIEQMHVCLGFPAVSEEDDDFYAAHLLTNILGGGMSSRLFQEVREKRGLSYSAYAYLISYARDGYLCAYASTRPQKLHELVKVIAGELQKIVSGGITDAELIAAKQQIKGSLLLGWENSGNVMNAIGKRLLTLGKLYSVQETLEHVMAVSIEDMENLAKRLLDPQKAVLSVVGALDKPLELSEIW